MDVVRLLLLFMCINHLVYASSNAEFGQNNCNCSPSPIDGYSPGSPTDGSFSPTTPTPDYSSPPPSGSGSGSSPFTPTPDYSSPPPVKGATPSTPLITPPYSDSPSTPTYTSPPSPSKGSSTSTPSYGSPPTPTSSSPSYGTPPVPSSSSPYTTPPLSSPSSPGYGSPSIGTTPPDVSTPSIPDGSVPSVPAGDGSSPSVPDGSAPSVPDLSPGISIPGLPGSGTGTCNFWGSHLSSLPDILSVFSSISDLFGNGSSFPSTIGGGLTLQEALRNKRKDGYGSLLREGSASLINSIVNPQFVLSAEEVRKQFNAAVASNTAAAVQGAKFKSINEGRLLP